MYRKQTEWRKTLVTKSQMNREAAPRLDMVKQSNAKNKSKNISGTAQRFSNKQKGIDKNKRGKTFKISRVTARRHIRTASARSTSISSRRGHCAQNTDIPLSHALSQIQSQSLDKTKNEAIYSIYLIGNDSLSSFDTDSPRHWMRSLSSSHPS